jgi:hypothetical protein
VYCGEEASIELHERAYTVAILKFPFAALESPPQRNQGVIVCQIAAGAGAFCQIGLCQITEPQRAPVKLQAVDIV